MTLRKTYYVQTECGGSGLIEAPAEKEHILVKHFGSLLGCSECAQISEWQDAGIAPDYLVDDSGRVWSSHGKTLW